MKLEPFCLNPRCSKCGSEAVLRVYQAGLKERNYHASCGAHGHPTVEHHDMHCQTCRYEWIEEVKGSCDRQHWVEEAIENLSAKPVDTAAGNSIAFVRLSESERDAAVAAAKHLQAEIARLKRGEWVAEEIHSICHNLHKTYGFSPDVAAMEATRSSVLRGAAALRALAEDFEKLDRTLKTEGDRDEKQAVRDAENLLGVGARDVSRKSQAVSPRDGRC